MKILKLTTIHLFVLLCFSCKKNVSENGISQSNRSSTDSTSTEMTNNLPYTSDRVQPYYKPDTDSVSYVVNTSYKGLQSDTFNEKDSSVPIKENDFEIAPDPKTKYYILETFKFSDQNTAKLIIYNTFGENDTKILNVQLNSYFNNVLTDKLLLDCRFTFETEYFRTFSIGKDKSITIVKHSVDKLEYNEAGDIVGEKKQGDSAKVSVEYSIDATGKFIKK